jgi:hypothetical protein
VTVRNQRLDHLLSPVQQRRLRKVWAQFQAALDEAPRNQPRINRLRAQLPPGGPSWPLWEVVLRDEITSEAAA